MIGSSRDHRKGSHDHGPLSGHRGGQGQGPGLGPEKGQGPGLGQEEEMGNTRSLSSYNPSGLGQGPGRQDDYYHPEIEGDDDSLEYGDTSTTAAARKNPSPPNPNHPHLNPQFSASGSLGSHPLPSLTPYSQQDLNRSLESSLFGFGSMHGYVPRQPGSRSASTHNQSRHNVVPNPPPSQTTKAAAVSASPFPNRPAAVLLDSLSSAAAIYEDSEPLPYGTHFIDESVLAQGGGTCMLAELVLACKEHLKHANSLTSADHHDDKDHDTTGGVNANARISPTTHGGSGGGTGKAKIGPCTDPAVVKNFYSRLDGPTRAMINKQATVQQFYESRIASLERYVAFCVMFHAMASTTARYEWSANPWIYFHVPWKWFTWCWCWSTDDKKGPWAWDVTRSQSNLRVATTASPIPGQSNSP